MVRTFDGSWGGHNDCAKYALTSYNENRASGFFAKNADTKFNTAWPSESSGNQTALTRAGYATASKLWSWCSVTFNYNELDELRKKTVGKILLEVEATLDSHVDVDMKKDAAGNSMTRCDRDGNTITETKLGAWYSTSPNYVSASEGVCTFDLTNDIGGHPAGVPRYGYCWGRNTSNTATSFSVLMNNSESALTTSKRATLYVITNERKATLSFNASGGTGAPASMDVVGPDGERKAKLPATVPAKSNVKFIGWALSSGGDVAYQPGDEIAVENDTTLYAKYGSVNVLLRYLAGTGGTGHYELSCKAGVTYNIVDVGYFVRKPGHVITGYSDTDGGEKQYSFGDHITMGNEDKILFAYWETATYTVTYDANGGSGAPDPDTKTGCVPLTLSETVPVRNGYRFLGWARFEGAPPEYRPGGTFEVDADTTLFAVWSEFGGYVRCATHDGVKKARAYIRTEDGITRAAVYVMTEDGLKEGM